MERKGAAAGKQPPRPGGGIERSMEQKSAEPAGGTAAGPRAYGFLTAVESGSHGVFGGYLLVDPLGRPLEFHCTAPVKVSRAQQILYGATLSGHLHGRQIGASLLAESTTTPLAILTDSEALLHVRAHTSLTVVYIGPAGAQAGQSEMHDATVTVGGITVCLPGGVSTAVVAGLEGLSGAVDLREPFERIRAAIEEAQRH